MRPWIAHRFAVISEILERPWFRVLFVIWLLSGVWDLAISQWIPEKYSQHLPKMYQMVAMTAGLLPWQVWLFAGVAIVAAAAIESAARHRAKLQSVGLAANSGAAKDQDPEAVFGDGIKPEWKIAALIVIVLAVGYGLAYYLSTLQESGKVTSSASFKSRIPRHAFVHKPAEPKSAPPPVVAAPAPPPKPPPPPWVTQSEIDEQRKAGHGLINYSPEELLKSWKQGSNIGAYFNKWIKIDYAFTSLLTETIDNRKYYVVKMNVAYGAYVLAYFEPNKWEDRIILLRPNDKVKAFCRFVGVDRKGELIMNYYFDDALIGYDCELLP
jgi:hypothetical protein